MWAIYVIPALAALLAYWPATRNGFIWDDPQVLAQIRAIRSIGDLFVLPPIIPKFYFRPLVFVSYLIDRSIAGETPYWFHVSVIATHALNSVLVALLALRWLPRQTAMAVAAGLLFAVWPVHTESVAWMAGRSDVIVGTFLLGTLLVSDRDDEWASGLASGTLLLAALLSKEIAIAGIVLIVGTDLIRGRGLRVSRVMPALAATGVYLLLRRVALGGAAPATTAMLPIADVMPNLFYAFGFYVTQAFAPIWLAAYVDQVPRLAGYLAAGLVAIAATGATIARTRGESRHATLAMALWFLAPLTPTFLVLLGNSASAPVADRYVYVPSIAAVIALAATSVTLAQRLRMPAVAWGAVILIVSVAAGLRTAAYSQAWTSNTTFWTDAALKNPHAALPVREVANGLMEQKRNQEAIDKYQQALSLRNDPEGLVTIHTNLGTLYRRLGDYTKATQEFEAALAVGPHPAIYHNLGMTLMAVVQEADQKGDRATVTREIARAKQAFENALALKTAPSSATFLTQWQPAKTYALLGQVLLSMGDAAGARHNFEESLRLEPSGPIAETTRGYLAQMQK